MKTAKITIIGFGAIGRGFAEVLIEKQDDIKKEFGLELVVCAICEIDGSLIDEKGIDLKDALEGNLREMRGWTAKKSLEVIEKTGSDIVLELTPSNIETGEPGLKHIKAALKSKKHVATSNKAPLAVAFKELEGLARENNVKLRYEATVGGAVPIINLREHTLQANKIESVKGIFNGTCNYVLTKMAEDNLSMDVALKEAQELGIAEADPSYDIKGIDTGAKVAILANSLLGMDVSFKDIKVKGIEEVTNDAIELAREHSSVIKLVGDVKKLEVAPRLIPVSHPLNVSGTLNAVTIGTDIAGEITVIGHGAGGRETASSILSDVIEICVGLSE